jgi:hypothetical protein
MTVEIKLKAFIKTQGYHKVELPDTLFNNEFEANKKRKFRKKYDSEFIKHDPIYTPIYTDIGDHNPYDYQELLLTDKDQQNLLIDFINISVLMDQDESKADEVILEFMHKWGSLTYAENIPETDAGILMMHNQEFGRFRIRSLFLSEKEWYERSANFRDILILDSKGKHKSAREKFLEIDRWVENDLEFDDMLDISIRPRNGLQALQYIFVTNLKNQNPLRNCPVCRKLFQRKVTAKQCSNKCKSLKSVRKFRSKK